MISYLIQRSEIGAGTRGSSLGPDAMRIASINMGSDVFIKHPTTILENHNESLYQSEETPTALRITKMLDTWEGHANGVLRHMHRGTFPVVISGDHGSAGATVAGIRMAHPQKRVGVVWIDAHADMHSPYTTPSGNMHGMPLAASIGEDNLEMRRNEPNETTKSAWDAMKNLGGIYPKIDPNDLVFVGVRDTEKEENHLMQKYGVTNFTVSNVHEKGAIEIAKEVLKLLEQCDLIYVSFDVDSMDPDLVSYGTGTPVKNGLSPDESKALLSVLLADQKTCCFEMVEVNPLLDHQGNKMAETAVEILEEAVKVLEQKAK